MKKAVEAMAEAKLEKRNWENPFETKEIVGILISVLDQKYHKNSHL